MIQVQDLRKLYGDLVAVDGISFEVAPGKIYGLLGFTLLFLARGSRFFRYS